MHAALALTSPHFLSQYFGKALAAAAAAAPARLDQTFSGAALRFTNPDYTLASKQGPVRILSPSGEIKPEGER